MDNIVLDMKNKEKHLDGHNWNAFDHMSITSG